MDYKLTCGLFLGILGVSSGTVLGQKKKTVKETRPNFVIIFSDDAGYADFGFTGSQSYPTPNLDKFAAENTIFERAYVTCPVSGPSRSGLLTGKYQQRFGFIHNNVPEACDTNAGFDPEEFGLPVGELTIGNYFRQIGYRTIAIGKWHQGFQAKFHPNLRGFDEFYGFLGGMRSYFGIDDPETEFMLWQNGQVLGETKEYFTQKLGRRACEYIEESVDRNEPFMMYLAFNAVHTPLHAPEEDLARFPHLERPQKQLAAMTMAMDREIGKVFETLKSKGIYDNTVIVFVNDNGGPVYLGADNGVLAGSKATLLEGGIRVPFIMKPTVQHKKQMPSRYTEAISTLDIIPTFLSMANAPVPQGLDGVDILPYVKHEKEGKPHHDLYWFFDGDFSAVMENEWKLIILPDRPVELYNVVEDISEKINRNMEYPEIVKRLYSLYNEWFLQMGRPRWQLRPEFTKKAIDRYDNYRK
jgi:arylsulfatase A-like enzyme